ncbi:MAG: response regulator [Bacteroidetes bacterium]|nr:response regulator [Bacteroidota bacterium]
MKVATKNKILVIEDDPAILTGLEDYLSAENYEIHTSQDGLEGLNIALNEHPDLILLDVNLPGLNGFEVCRKLREENFVNPIIIITASAEQVDEVVGLEIGADDYIKKPFILREVLARIRANLRQSERKISVEEDVRQHGEKFNRNLMCIMFTDIKDYSKKMHEDELLTIELLQMHNRIMNEVIAKFNGKIIEIVGDAFVVSFNSAVKTVSCGVAIQEKFKKYNSLKSQNEEIELRMGIHLGDLVEFEGKYKGDAMNIAARIQQNAKESEIWMSESVYLAVRGKVKFKFNKVGLRNFKNIKEPITIYSISE